MSEKISVVVTAYNIESYIAECLDSLLLQDYPDYEIIVVDDGSSDNTGAISDEYAQKSDKIKVIHQKNGGVSAARNAGLDAASGDYIALVDGDDSVSPKMFSTLLSALKDNDADMCICNYTKVWKDGQEKRKHTDVMKGECAEPHEALKWIERPHSWSYVVVWPRLYKRHVFDNLRFPQGKIHEDEFLVHKIYLACKKIVTIKDSLYYYRDNPKSIMRNSPLGISHIDRFEAVYERFQDYKKLGYTDLLPGTVESAKYNLSKVNNYIVKSPEDKKRITDMCRVFKEMVKDKSCKSGLLNHIIAISPKTYYKIRGIFKKD